MEYVYVVLLLNKCGKEVNEENIKKVLSAADVKVDEAKVKALVSALKDINIEETIKEAAVVPTATVEKKEEKKEEKPKEEKKDAEAAASGLGSLFG
ncbi:MAG: 50S ribosomal protein P1 [Nanoarchaeota archaeon]|nr:50S ribosomal protein P1 [Nanoarchaeota archaeon]